MKKIFAVLMAIGLILIVAGFGIQIAAANNENFKNISEAAEYIFDLKLTPQTVGKVLKDGISVWGEKISFTDLIDELGSYGADAQQILSFAKLYAATPTMIFVGIGFLAAGIVLLVLNKRNGRSRSADKSQPKTSEEDLNSETYWG